MLLFYWQGLTHREVAAELNISVGAVKARLHQARAALERTLPMCTTPEVPAIEVDARPSDALNLALVADSPIKVDARLLDNPRAVNQPAWQNYRTRGPELVTELRERQQEMMTELHGR